MTWWEAGSTGWRGGHWIDIEKLSEDEARYEAERLVQRFSQSAPRVKWSVLAVGLDSISIEASHNGTSMAVRFEGIPTLRWWKQWGRLRANWIERSLTEGMSVKRWDALEART